MEKLELIRECLEARGFEFTYSNKYGPQFTIGPVSDGVTLYMTNDGKSLTFNYYKVQEEIVKNEDGLTKENVEYILNDVVRMKALYEDDL